jgi:hypothetical protein
LLPSPDRKADAFGLIAAAALGVAAFFAWAGWTFLNPENVSWLRFGDRAMHTLGWWFYRASPWGFPLGINPRNGIEISSSVALSDSLPLFAVPFKLLSPLLPAMFQYWGIWFLLCMVLQGLVGYAIGRELRLSRLASLLLGAFLLLTPAFLFRLPIHMALAGHWTLLAALYLYVRQVPLTRWMWPLLLALTSAVHAYLLAMVLTVWVASVVERLWQRRIAALPAAIEAVAGLGLALLVLWSVGFFMTPSLGADGFGFYRMNLDAFLDPNNWSRLLPDLPSTAGDYEGFIYPGLGVLGLLALGLVAAGLHLRALISPRWLPLLIATIGMAMFAASDKLVFGSTQLVTIPLPPTLLDFVSMFRASGRMIWPAGYLAVLLAFVLLDRRFGARALVVVAGLALIVQGVDTSRGWTQFQSTQVASAASWPIPLKSPFWALAATRYPRLRAIPVRELNHAWAELSYFAAFHGMASDAAYLGRQDARGFVRLAAMADAALTEGRFDPEALYVLDTPSATIARRFAGPDDLLAEVDGMIVFARHGKWLADAGYATPLAPLPQASIAPKNFPAALTPAPAAALPLSHQG